MSALSMGRPSPPGLFFSSFIAVGALDVMAPGPTLLRGGWAASGWLLVAAGAWLHTVAFRLFRRLDTTLATLDSPRVLVKDGPFRVSRNPMYAAGVLILAGLGLATGSAAPLLVPPIFALLAYRWYIRGEEELLEAEFGEEYVEYRSRVRRWL